ncbi:MAG: ABC transporter substrate-binding protein, partial [Sphaerochaetaceae bacterium]|nr:ABC transporter substrate-binding protein [Sphaerochaetaceae bacterium]
SALSFLPSSKEPKILQRILGSLIDGKKDKAEEIASFIDTTIEMASANKAKIQESEVVSLMFSSASQGLGTNAKGSSQAKVLDIVGVKNAIELETTSNKGGGSLINMEQLYNFDPDVIVFAESKVYETVGSDATWQNLKAIKNNKYYLVPEQPYNWLSNPPSLNMVLGIWWLGNLVYPQYYDYDMAQVAKDVYKLFWDYELTDAEVSQMLENSIVKSKNQ